MSTKTIQDTIVDHLIARMELACFGETEPKPKKNGKKKEPEPHPRKERLESIVSKRELFGCARKDVINLVAILTGVKVNDPVSGNGRLKDAFKVYIVTGQSYSNNRHDIGKPVVVLSKDGNCFGMNKTYPLRYDYVMEQEVRLATKEEAREFIDAIKANMTKLSDWINQFSLKAFAV